MDVSNYAMRLRWVFHDVLTCHDRLTVAPLKFKTENTLPKRDCSSLRMRIVLPIPVTPVFFRMKETMLKSGDKGDRAASPEQFRLLR